jgi:hypothetical protein
MIPVYVLARTPGATDTVEWTAICHRREAMVYISHEVSYTKSRWRSETRRRPFAVYYCSGGRVSSGMAWSYHASLAAAEKAARKIAKGE